MQLVFQNELLSCLAVILSCVDLNNESVIERLSKELAGFGSQEAFNMVRAKANQSLLDFHTNRFNRKQSLMSPFGKLDMQRVFRTEGQSDTPISSTVASERQTRHLSKSLLNRINSLFFKNKNKEFLNRLHQNKQNNQKNPQTEPKVNPPKFSQTALALTQMSKKVEELERVNSSVGRNEQNQTTNTRSND